MKHEQRQYTVRQLADMAGVSVRTLHHYDQIGLLVPSTRTEKGYRLYGQEELLRLQQVLFYRELDFPLEQIAVLLDRPGFDPAAELERHGMCIRERIQRMTTLLSTIEKTLNMLKGEETMLTDKELYEGFEPGQGEKYTEEAKAAWGQIVDRTNARLRKLSKEEWGKIKEEGDDLTRKLAALMDREPGDNAVQEQIGRHYGWIRHFYEPTPEIYRGLGTMYADDPRFRATYDKYRTGLADFLKKAIEYYCDHTLNGK